MKRDGSLWELYDPPVGISPGGDWASLDTTMACGIGPAQITCTCATRVALAVSQDGSLWRNDGPNFTRNESRNNWAAVAIIAAAVGTIQVPPCHYVRANFLGLAKDGALWNGWWSWDGGPGESSSRINDDIDWGPPWSLPLSNDCYSVLYRGGNVTNISQPVDMRLLPSARAFQLTDLTPASSNASAFYRVRQMPSALPLDSDADGIDDVYELRRPGFLNSLNASDAGQDFDGDGKSNLKEYQDGTDPEIP